MMNLKLVSRSPRYVAMVTVFGFIRRPGRRRLVAQPGGPTLPYIDLGVKKIRVPRAEECGLLTGDANVCNYGYHFSTSL